MQNNLQALIEQNNFIALAPLAGITDLPFRLICIECGAKIVYTEMISAKALSYKNQKSLAMLKTLPAEAPCVAQLFGSETEIFASVVKDYLHNSAFAGIDINMGCPVPKVVKNGDGSALMRTPEKAYDIVRAVKDITDKPLSVKIRAGWCEEEKNAVDFAVLMQRAGANLLIVHPRTREMFFTGQADHNITAEIKQRLTIPVIANGDIASPEDAMRIWRQTGADGIMIGQAALSNPWLFQQIADYRAGRAVSLPAIQTRIELIQKHLQRACAHYGEKIAIPQMRKNLFWYTKGLKGSNKIRSRIATAISLPEVDAILDELMLLNAD